MEKSTPNVVGILNLRLARIGGNTTNFLDSNQLKKHREKIQNDPKMIKLMDEINQCYEQWCNEAARYEVLGRAYRDLATKRFKELTGEKYV